MTKKILGKALLKYETKNSPQLLLKKKHMREEFSFPPQKGLIILEAN
jgi:hypothetical protein